METDTLKQKKEVITWIRRQLAELGPQQTKCKRLRKTKLDPVEKAGLQAEFPSVVAEAKEYTYPGGTEAYRISYFAAAHVSRQAARITALLNLYHEVRGSKHRHGQRDPYWYEKARKEIREELNRLNLL